MYYKTLGTPYKSYLLNALELFITMSSYALFYCK